MYLVYRVNSFEYQRMVRFLEGFEIQEGIFLFLYGKVFGYGSSRKEI